MSEILNPSTIAVVGASEDQSKFGGRLMRMLIKHNFKGTVFPINPARDTLFGIKTFNSLEALPQIPDMAVMVLPNSKIKEQITIAGKLGVKSAIVIASGFSDAGEDGAVLEREIVEIAHSYGMRIIGPNCLGIISAVNSLVLCSSPILEKDTLPIKPIGFVSQSGALMTTYFDRMWSSGGGFTHGFSVGNQADLELCDFVEFLIDDPETKVICTYVEGIKDVEAFRRMARKARQAGKPWLAVKAGRSSAGSAAAFSHTASVAGDHVVFESVCRDEGILLVEDMGAMFVLANLLSKQNVTNIEKIAIVTPSGGGGALAADALAENDIHLAVFEDSIASALSAHFPKGQANNPIDFGARTTADSYIVASEIIKLLNNDKETDLIFIPVAMCPPDWTDALLQAVVEQRNTGTFKPVLFAIDAGLASKTLRDKLEENDISYANSTTEAVNALKAWNKRSEFIERTKAQRPDNCKSSLNLTNISKEFNEEESKAILADYGLPVALGSVVNSKEQAEIEAEKLGYPLVMKIISPDIIHKTEAGGVLLNIRNRNEASKAYEQLIKNAKNAVPNARIEGVSIQQMAQGKLELIIGAKRDEQFGPVVIFGGGGILVELLPENAVACAPIHPDDVKKLLEKLSVGAILQGYRGMKLDLEGVVDSIVRASWLAYDLSNCDFELDINPLIVASERSYAVDARLKIEIND